MLDDTRADAGSHMNVAGMVEDGIRLARRGDRNEAEMLFRRVIQIAPDNEDGWLWMAWLAETREESLRYLREGLRFSPESPSLREGVAWVEAHKPSAVSAATDSGPSAEAGRPTVDRATPRGPSGRRIPTDRPRSGTADAGKRKAAASRFQGQRRRLRLDVSSWLDRAKSVGVAVISLGVIAVLAGVVILLVNQTSQAAPAVAAMVLPTPIIDATPTPSVESLARPLWTKVEIAFGQDDWGAAIIALDQIRAMDPQSTKARERLSAALYERALDYIDENELELARRDLDRAIILDADSPNLQSTRRDIQLYRSALEAYLEQDWANAVALLTQVYERRPDFRDTRSMLGQAHCHLAELQLQSDSLDDALAQATLCEQILEGDEEAEALVKQVVEAIRPPRRIEVSLSDYRARVYENNEVIQSFPICYGRPSHPTKTGRFQVQTKMDNAYGSAWDLNMPYWLGIYWAGGTENGFHALPILSSGTTLWAGSLGTRCSFGCIVLGTNDAKWLYDWATIGTVVFVND
ncbi:MAG: L,D-transpeptidase family protein [Chloroflexi bacterium]|nr:L,D-transpeptidase family protein [Chloroflexota bacterium]